MHRDLYEGERWYGVDETAIEDDVAIYIEYSLEKIDK